MTAPRAKRPPGERSAMLAKLHLAAKYLALTEESYRDVLARATGQRSAADCSDAQLHDALAEFARLGWAPRTRPGARHRRRARIAGDMMPLVGKIRALWGALDNLGALDSGAESALDRFVKRQAKVDAVAFLTPHGANLTIEALKAWCARQGFEVPKGGFEAKRALLHAQWAALDRLGALKVPSESALHIYVSRIVSPHETVVEQLSAPQLDAAADHLGKWIRRVKARAKSAGEDKE